MSIFWGSVHYGQGGVGNAGLISDITIIDNAFVNSGNAIVSINSASDVTVKNNFMFRPCSEISTSPKNCAVYTSSSFNLTIEDNVMIPAIRDGFAAIAVGDRVDERSIKASNLIL